MWCILNCRSVDVCLRSKSTKIQTVAVTTNVSDVSACKGIRMSGAFQLLSTKAQEASSRTPPSERKPVAEDEPLPFPGRMALSSRCEDNLRLHDVPGGRQHEAHRHLAAL